MNLFTYRISLDVHETASQTYINVKKADTARKFLFTLTDNGKAYQIGTGCTAVFRAKKPDGTILYNNCTITGNIIEYAITSQTVAAVGVVECEVTLYDSDSKQITSPRFAMIVEDTLYSDSEVESQDEFTELQVAIAAAQGLAGVNATVTKSGTTATITTVDNQGVTHTATVSDGQNGQEGDKGDTGDSGVYIGTTPPTDPTVKVWIDTSGSSGDVEMVSNKVTSISGSSTDTQYPSAKCVYDAVNTGIEQLEADVEDINEVIPSQASSSNQLADKAWVEAKGYLTQHQSLSAYQTQAITDTGGYFTTDTVEGALQEIGAELAGINTLIGTGVIT